MGRFQARAVGKGDYDGIRRQIVEVLDQPGYDDGEWREHANDFESTADRKSIIYQDRPDLCS
jgi:hypothetical protein